MTDENLHLPEDYVKTLREQHFAERIADWQKDGFSFAVLNMDDIEKEFPLNCCEYLCFMLNKLKDEFDKPWFLEAPGNEFYTLIEAKAELTRCVKRVMKIHAREEAFQKGEKIR